MSELKTDAEKRLKLYRESLAKHDAPCWTKTDHGIPIEDLDLDDQDPVDYANLET